MIHYIEYIIIVISEKEIVEIITTTNELNVMFKIGMTFYSAQRFL